jgi:hypothetical protein
MMKHEFEKQFLIYLDAMRIIMQAKNFSLVEKAGICSTEQGFLARISDKFSRISTFVKKGVLEVKEESLEDTLLDLANYALLLACYIKGKRNESETPRIEPEVEKRKPPSKVAGR